MKQYSFLLEIESLAPTRNPESEVGDPIGGVDSKTEAMRRAAKRVKAQAELVAAKAQLKKTSMDASQIDNEIKSKQEEARNAEIDKQRQAAQQQQEQMQAQQAAQNQVNDVNNYVQQASVQPQQDPTVDPNAQG